MNRWKLAAWLLLAAVAAVAGGWLWGTWGRLGAERALDQARLRLDLAEARGHVLDARLSLYSLNFGDASRRLEEAKPPLRQAMELLKRHSETQATARLTAAMTHINEAQQLAGKLDQAANSKAGEAVNAIDGAIAIVIGTGP